MNSRLFSSFFIFMIIFAIVLPLTSCEEEGPVISKPDEYKRVFEARQNIILQAIAQVFKDKALGTSRIDYDKNQVETDYSVQGDWRSKSVARVKTLNWKECEVILSVITERKTRSGWDQRRLLEQKQYDNFFDAIELQIYNESYKIK